jgi:hypothetical protein
MSQAFLNMSGCKDNYREPTALIGHGVVLTRGRRSTHEDVALLTKQQER